MLNGVTASLSAMMAAEKKLEVASRNVANASTHGYKARTLTLTEAPGGGVSAREGVSSQPVALEPRLPEDAPAPVELSNVSLVEEVGGMTLAKPLYQANLKVLETQDEMLGSLLDVVR